MYLPDIPAWLAGLPNASVLWGLTLVVLMAGVLTGCARLAAHIHAARVTHAHGLALVALARQQRLRTAALLAHSAQLRDLRAALKQARA